MLQVNFKIDGRRFELQASGPRKSLVIFWGALIAALTSPVTMQIVALWFGR